MGATLGARPAASGGSNGKEAGIADWYGAVGGGGAASVGKGGAAPVGRGGAVSVGGGGASSLGGGGMVPV